MKTPEAPADLNDQDLDDAAGGAPLIAKTLSRNERPAPVDPTANLTGKVKVDENGDPIFDYPDDFAP